MKTAPILEHRSLAATADTPRSWLWRLIGFVAGGLFVYAGIIKAMDPLKFADDITNYHIVPWSVAARTAFYLPWLEILCGLAVIFRKLYTGALAMLIGMMLVFVAATISAKVRGIDITCGCFGKASSNLSFGGHLVLDLVILGAFVALWLGDRPAR